MVTIKVMMEEIQNNILTKRIKEENNMDYLSKEEIERAKSCIANIEDKLNAIKTEIYSREHPYKTYIREKASSITWDINVINHMVKEEENNEES